MARSPLQNVAIAGVYQTQQGRALEGRTSAQLAVECVQGLLENTGLSHTDIDGVSGGAYGTGGGSGSVGSHQMIHQLGINANWYSNETGVNGVLAAASAISNGICDVAIVLAAQAGVYSERESVAPWTRQPNEFVESFGYTTPSEMAQMARRHMHQFGTTSEQIAYASATIRNNGHINPNATYYNRGPFTVEDIMVSRMVATPLHLLDICTVTEGGAGILLTSAERARDLKSTPVYLLGAGMDRVGPSHTHPLVMEFSGSIGRKAAQRAFGMAGIGPEDVDSCEFYDPVSWDVIRQLEVYGFCPDGEGGRFIENGTIEIGGKYPICTDGGLMSFSHPGSAQLSHKVIASVRQLRGECGERQVKDAEVSMATNGAAAAFWRSVVLLGKEQA